MTERLIITGLINSTEFLQQVRPVWDPLMIVSRSAQQIAEWCVEFYDEYQVAPERNIDDIYFDKKRAKAIPRDMVEELEEALEDLAMEFDEKFNVRYALDQAGKYFQDRHLELHKERVDQLIEEGNTEEARKLSIAYKGPIFELVDDLDLGDAKVLDRLDGVFSRTKDPLIKYPGALGQYINDYLTRGSFVSLLASEKRGKSFWLLDMAVRATMLKNKVAFFQAGDMTEDQQLIRIASYLTKLPSSENYVGTVHVPRADCIMNQLDLCEKEERRCGFGSVLGEYDEDSMRRNVERDVLIEAYEDFGEDYRPCTVCTEFRKRPWGTPWLIPKKITHMVTVDEAKRKFKKHFIDKHKHFKISTHPNNTLTVSMIKNIINRWENTDGFVPDVVVIDYADLLVAEGTKEFRHQQNEVWKNLRALSTERDCLVLTATQADAKSYEKDLLQMGNFSEDKRKFAHVTAMFGLNQDKHSREKKLGIMRINKIVVREGEFDSTSTVSVLQSLSLGQPFLDSYI